MKTSIAFFLIALAAASSATVQATPLGDVRRLQVSQLEFGAFRLEMALAGIRDWPSPINGAGVTSHVDPDRIEIVVALGKVRADAFRAACARTIERVREFLYVDANGVPRTGRSNLGFYFQANWAGPERETALRAIDAVTQIRVDVVGAGSCHAGLVKTPVTFAPTSAK
ncbi:MAG TPA: hypothetical protein VNT02_06550 [Burkholderiales bacterium]|nr:hypothetical protein [Burkholderiales bacterium]